MNSENKKPGPHGVFMWNLIWFEHEWYSIFNGMAFGIPGKNRVQTVWEPVQGPKLLAWLPESKRPRGYEQLDRERLREWDSNQSEKWQRVQYIDVLPEIPPEPEVWLQIKQATSPTGIHAAIARSAIWLKAEIYERSYVKELSEHATEFLLCKTYRYPASARRSSEIKRVIHFSRAMAGIMEGISAARAIDLFRALTHGNRCNCILCSIERNNSFLRLLGRERRAAQAEEIRTGAPFG